MREAATDTVADKNGAADKNGMTARLEKDLEEFDRIILMDVQPENRQAAELFYASEALQASSARILILCGGADERQGNVTRRHATVTWRYVGESERSKLLQIYHMYEFSNRVSVFSQEEGFGGLHNLVRTGVLTVEEAVTAFLHQV